MSAQDLIVEYHRRDLSEAEEESLACLLEESPEAALRFAELAADDYSRFGLPEPDRGGNNGRWMVLLLLGLGGAWAWTQRPVPAPLAVHTVSEEDGGFSVVRRVAPVSVPAAPVEEAPSAPAAPAPSLEVRSESAAGPFDILVLNGRASAEGIFDGAGRPVGRLREVNGRHFRWDGRDSAGRLVAAGAYQIRLVSGGKPLRQWVEIEVR